MALRFAVALTAMMVSVAAGQRPPTLTRLETGTCPTCSVTVELIATVGRASDAELIADLGRLTSLADGGFVVTSQPASMPLLRYDRRGAFIGTLGTTGNGPGELRWPTSVVRARGDSISLMGEHRITTISTLSGRGRSEPLPVTLEGFYHLVLSDGTVIVNVSAQRQVAFAALTARSALTKRFGPEQSLLVLPQRNGPTVGDIFSTWMVLAPSRTRGFWAASTHYEHHIQHLSGDGSVLSDIRRRPTWFQPYQYADIREKLYRLGELRTPRPSVTLGIGVDSAGFVFVVSRVADAHWQKDPKAPPPTPPGKERRPEALVPTGGVDRYVDGVLEVYNDKSGAFLGSWRSDSPFTSLTHNGLLYAQEQDADGVTTFRVYRVRVVGAK